ncbi:MAG: glycoside hydrolase family 13 protein [Bacteroidota bacterium]|uniref:Glycoside hydrolase family 13 protein n=1 Tax=Flagellimonas okinawensis TaxID=3031324 RepID=A0ABT5XLI5_9FLAO|nr:glycoside hydrolase family 13 protein [[Muricauda] okinawensis]MDF0706496.1 glycoside hydrolase family 13 protein [[Muricauda] okinawensis]MEC8831393.1 glycoside hydrolase family 13 protein [Bacteroidota bacterium]
MRKVTTLVLLAICSFAFGQIERVEPPNWWANMNSTELELLVYGDNISNLDPEFSGNINIKKVVKVENPNYLFVTVDTEDITAGTHTLSLKKGKRTVDSFNYEFKTRRDGSEQRKGFDSSDVIYLLMPDRFANGDPSNDSTSETIEKANREHQGGRHGGDIQGIIDHLDYINELGATTLWSTPLTLDNEKVYSYHGYASSDLYKIDPRYGSNEDFASLSAELHKRNMKHIMDFVPNHWGLSHWLIQDLPSSDWIHFWEGGENGFKRSNYIQTTQFDPYASEIDAKGCMDGWFDYTMPDMNENNPMLITYLVQNAIWWIESGDLDGIRVDTYPYNDKKGITEWVTRVMEEYPNFNVMGEIFMHETAHIAYWQKDSKVGAIQGFNSNLPTVMDFPLHDILPRVFKEDQQNWGDGVYRIYDHLTKDFLYPNINNLLIKMGNHDVNRINQEFDGDVDKYKMALTLIMTLRGIPQIYYGDEIGMLGDKGKGDGDIRRDFPGGWTGDEQDAFTSKGRTTKQNEYFEFTKNLLNWRKGKKAIHFGETLHFSPVDNVYVYFRYLPDNPNETVMVVLNNSNKDQKIDLARFEEGIQSHTKALEIISGMEYEINQNLDVAAKSGLVFELK